LVWVSLDLAQEVDAKVLTNLGCYEADARSDMTKGILAAGADALTFCAFLHGHPLDWSASDACLDQSIAQ
jgi:hypothetical protein